MTSSETVRYTFETCPRVHQIMGLPHDHRGPCGKRPIGWSQEVAVGDTVTVAVREPGITTEKGPQMTMTTVTETTIAEIQNMDVERLLACVQHQRGHVEINYGGGSPGHVSVKVSIPWGFASSSMPRNAFTSTPSGEAGLRPLLMEAVLDCYQQAVTRAKDTNLAEAISHYWLR